jgi:triosephosphate isomerase
LPFVYLPLVKSAGALKIGAQDVASQEAGPWTGEVSAKMIKAMDANYALVGHSERRELGESDELINKKMYQGLSHGLKTILCVGEKEKSHEAFPGIVRNQIKSALNKIPRHLSGRTIIAYEPVWAISSNSGGRADTPQNFFEMSIFIRRTVLDIWGKQAALKLPIIYGGSVNAKNAEGFLNVDGGSGVLVGKSSLNAEEFKRILEIADKK